jgi:NAD(P)-dependent dehydrogenase (short-subunit alcohol dehydrogenase family)
VQLNAGTGVRDRVEADAQRTVDGAPTRAPLAGRVALVTGGARGIGRGIAAELLRAGAHVVVGDIDEREMEETCRELRVVGPVDWVRLDVSAHDSIRQGVAAIAEKHGPIAILVNNAGIAAPGLFADEEPRTIAKALAVDLSGAICLTRLTLPGMIASGWGRVVNVSSMMAFSGSPGFAVYSAAKAGLLAFSEAVGREVRQHRHVRVTAVLPPSVKTHAFEEAKRANPDLMRWSLVPPVSVETVARRTVHGLISGRRRVYTSVQSYGASLLVRLAPWLMDWLLMYMFQSPTRPSLPSHGPPRHA